MTEFLRSPSTCYTLAVLGAAALLSVGCAASTVVPDVRPTPAFTYGNEVCDEWKMSEVTATQVREKGVYLQDESREPIAQEGIWQEVLLLEFPNVPGSEEGIIYADKNGNAQHAFLTSEAQAQPTQTHRVLLKYIGSRTAAYTAFTQKGAQAPQFITTQVQTVLAPHEDAQPMQVGPVTGNCTRP